MRGCKTAKEFILFTFFSRTEHDGVTVGSLLYGLASEQKTLCCYDMTSNIMSYTGVIT